MQMSDERDVGVPIVAEEEGAAEASVNAELVYLEQVELWRDCAQVKLLDEDAVCSQRQLAP